MQINRKERKTGGQIKTETAGWSKAVAVAPAADLSEDTRYGGAHNDFISWSGGGASIHSFGARDEDDLINLVQMHVWIVCASIFFLCDERLSDVSSEEIYYAKKTSVHTWYIIIDRIADWNICLTAKVFHYNIWNFFYWSWFLTNNFFLCLIVFVLSLDRIRRHKFSVAIVDLFSWLLAFLHIPCLHSFCQCQFKASLRFNWWAPFLNKNHFPNHFWV